MTPLDAVVVDLSPHPQVSYAVVLAGQLLPIRFSTEREAYTHLGMLTERNPIGACARCGKDYLQAQEDCQQPTCPMPVPRRVEEAA